MLTASDKETLDENAELQTTEELEELLLMADKELVVNS